MYQITYSTSYLKCASLQLTDMPVLTYLQCLAYLNLDLRHLITLCLLFWVRDMCPSVYKHPQSGQLQQVLRTYQHIVNNVHLNGVDFSQKFFGITPKVLKSSFLQIRLCTWTN